MRKRKKSSNWIVIVILILLFGISIGYSVLSSTLSMSGAVTVQATPPTPSNTYPVNYAVQIYGINEDVDENDNIIGLTFGPAVGDDYNNKYVTHTYEETSPGSGVYNVKIVTHTVMANGTESTTSEYLYKNGETTENVTRTEEQKNRYDINIHEMTWAEIANVSDKTDFLDCMLCGDTKKVELALNDTIGSGTEFTQYGDGTGVLYGALNPYYRMWNPSYNNSNASYNNSAVGTGVSLDSNEQNYGSTARNAGGYSVSHIRATLIGENSKTNIGYAGDVNLSESTSLYSCLPSDLKNVITAKKVRYVTGSYYTSGNYSQNDDIADKIWAFSQREARVSGLFAGVTTEGLRNNGQSYSKFLNSNSKYYISSYTQDLFTIANTPQRVFYNESGNISYPWIRTLTLGLSYLSLYLSDEVGYINLNDPTYVLIGLAFGFCIN